MEYMVFNTEFGYAMAVSSEGSLIRFYLPVENNDDAVNRLRQDYPAAEEKDTHLLREARSLIKSYFKGVEIRFNRLPVSPGDFSDFGEKVLAAVSAIPYGQTRTYKWAAKEAGEKDAARAAGNILNKNPLPVIIPCHRVIQSGGEIGGFSSGLKWKMKLLQIEKILI